MGAKHTPGPWVAGNYFAQRHGTRTYLPIIRPGNDPFPVAVVHRDVDRYGRQEGEANARLIAAAPELLSALFNLVGLASPHFTDETQLLALSEARAAIKKAEAA